MFGPKCWDLIKTPHVSQNTTLIKTFKSVVLKLNCILAIFHLTKVGMGRELASILPQPTPPCHTTLQRSLFQCIPTHSPLPPSPHDHSSSSFASSKIRRQQSNISLSLCERKFDLRLNLYQSNLREFYLQRCKYFV